MPNRIIKDVAVTSRKLAAASDFGERLYWRVFQVVDDFGRFHADPQILTARCFPIGPAKRTKVRMGRDELATLGLIVIYQVGTEEILQVTNWSQRIRSRRSKFPAPDDRHMTVICPSSDNQLVQGCRLNEDVDVDEDVDDNPPTPLKGGRRRRISAAVHASGGWSHCTSCPAGWANGPDGLCSPCRLRSGATEV